MRTHKQTLTRKPKPVPASVKPITCVRWCGNQIPTRAMPLATAALAPSPFHIYTDTLIIY